MLRAATGAHIRDFSATPDKLLAVLGTLDGWLCRALGGSTANKLPWRRCPSRISPGIVAAI